MDNRTIEEVRENETKLINDLKATANGYESDRNICRGQLDSLTQELERWQNE